MRRAAATDVPFLAALDARCHPHPWSEDDFRNELANPSSEIWLTDHAYVVAWRILDELQIQNVTTAPEARRQGHARALLEHVLAAHTATGATFATLELRENNTAALRLYESLGFTIVGRRPGYYSTGEAALLMRRERTRSPS